MVLQARRSFAAAVLLCISPSWAQEAEAPDEVVLVTAARVPVPVSDSTATATVFDAADIRARGAVFAADLLRATPGLAVSRSGGAGQLTQIRLRGSEANHVLVLIDGIEAGSPFTGEADFSHFAFDDLSRVEVLRGEQSALWGADAIGGVISLTTARPSETREATARFEAGSFETLRAGARLAAPIGNGWGSASFSAYETAGVDVSGQGGEKDDYANLSFSLAGSQALSANWRLSGLARHVAQDSQFDSDIDFDGLLDDSDRRRDGAQSLAGLSLEGGWTAAGADWSSRFILQGAQEEVDSFTDGRFSGRTDGRRIRGAAQLTARRGAHRLTGLIEAERDKLENFGGPGAGLNQDRRIESDALALDYGWSQGAWDATASARREFNDLFDDSTTWRIGLARDLPALRGRLRASAGEGVKNPGLFELYGFFPDFFTGNPELRPERSFGWEVGFSQQLAGGDLSWGATWFRSELEDEIFTDFGVFPYTAANASADSVRQGLELEGRWRVSESLNIFGSASILDSEQGGVTEIRRPDRLASLTADWRPDGEPWSASLAVDHVGEQTDTDFSVFRDVTLDAYTLVGGQLGWRVAEGAQLYLRGENLSDEEVVDVVGFASPGRGLFIGLRLGR
jgi:vitamin B12 transporter